MQPKFELWLYQTYPYCKTIDQLCDKIKHTSENKFNHHYSDHYEGEFQELLIKTSNWREINGIVTPFVEIQSLKTANQTSDLQKVIDVLLERGENVWVHGAVEGVESLQLDFTPKFIHPFTHYYKLCK